MILLRNVLDQRVRVHNGFPVAPGAFPVVGHLPVMATEPLAFLRDTERRVGPFFWVDVGRKNRQLACMAPEAFSTVFRNRTTTSNYLRDVLPELFGESMIVQDGAPHQHARSAMNGPFTPRGLNAAEIGATFAGSIARRVETWIARREIRLLAEARELVLELMFAMLGVTSTELGAWRRAYEDLMLLAISLPGPTRWRGARARAWLDDRVLALVARARADAGAAGLLPALVRGRDEGGLALSDAELVDNVRLLLLAGHETSASTIAWMVLVLAQRPDVWTRLCAEALAADGVPTSPKELRAFPYAEAVFRETLRLHPPVTSDARRATVDFELCGRTVPAGAHLSVSLLHLSRHPSLYERPEEFDPERWLGRAEAPSPLELAQFGGGPHFCLGYHLAWLEIVQFAVAFARALGTRGRSPALVGPPPRARYLPLMHPDASARVRFA